MKKIIIILGLLFCFHNSAIAVIVPEQTLKTTDMITYTKDGKFGLKDKQGNIIVDAEYKKIIRLGTTSWIVQKGSRFGVIDCQGNTLIKTKYRNVERLFGKYVKLGNDNDYGIYDEYGVIMIPPEYSEINPLYGEKFLTCKNYKYGVVDINGNVLLDNIFDDIYMLNFNVLRVQYEGEWFEIEKINDKNIELPENVKKITINDDEFKVTHLVTNTGIISGYSAVTLADYVLKIVSSISPAYEESIDDLMLSQGADTVSIFVRLNWLPKFPATYVKNYYQNLRNPNNGPLSQVKNKLKRQIK